MDTSSQPPKFLTVAELASIIRLSAGTIKNLLSKKPQALPPRRVVCGTRAVLFFSEDVDRWMRGLPVLQGVGCKLDKNNKVVERFIPIVAPGEDAQKVINSASGTMKRGRPTKAMQRARDIEKASLAGRVAQ